MIVGSLLLIVVAVGLLVLGLLQGADALLVASIGASLLAAVALIVGGRQAAAARAQRTGRQVPSERYDPLGSRIAPDDLDLDAPRGGRQPVGAGARTSTTYGTGAGTGTAHGAGIGIGTTPSGGPGGSGALDETAMKPAREELESVRPPARADDERRRHDEYPSAAAQEAPAYQAAAGGYSRDDDDDDEYDADYDEADPADEPPVQPSSAADTARVAALDAEVLVIDGRPRYHVANCPHLLGRESEPLPAHEAVELGFTPCGACTPNDVLLAAQRRP